MKKLLIAVTAALAALTMSIPAHAVDLKPKVTYVDNERPAVSGGTEITVTGLNLGTVTSVTVDNAYGIVKSKAATKLVFRAPQHALGPATVLITNPAGTTSFIVTYSPQRRALVPSPKVPATLKVGKTAKIVGQDPAWTITITTDTPKICKPFKNTIKGLKKGNCVVNITINPDTAAGSNPNWRGKIVVNGIQIN